ncbi:MAG: helix-turn-helix domain-containing protein [Clostridia bacterium]|nr:helix-turn-helix domain-containing protein [Clostridia bacterium]
MRFTKEERRKQILAAATKLFVEKGYHTTRTKDIAQACAVTEPVIYKHFSSKEELFLEVIASIAGETFNNISFDSANDTEDILTSFVLNKAESINNNFSLFKRLLSELMDNERIRRDYYDKFLPRLAHPLIFYLDQLKEQKMIKEETSSKVILLGLAGIMMIGSLAKNLEEKSAYADIDSRELYRQMMHIYLHGLLQK